MHQVTISKKYQVVIPKAIRREVPLVAGQIVQVIAKYGVIILVPDRPLSSLRGFLKGTRSDGYREKPDRV